MAEKRESTEQILEKQEAEKRESKEQIIENQETEKQESMEQIIEKQEAEKQAAEVPTIESNLPEFMKDEIDEIAVPQPAIVEKEPEPTVDVAADSEKSAPKTTLDLFSGNGATLADKFIKDDDSSVASKIKKQSVSDLKKVIGINEKFLFINELFDGNMSSYEQAVDALNHCTSNLEANSLTSKYKTAYNWDTSANAYKKFHEILELRFQ